MSHKLAISSMSLGRCFAGHALNHRLDLAQKYGFEGIELFHEDLAYLAEHLSAEDAECESSAGAQMAAARQIETMCRDRGLQIICLQPFVHYDGLVDREEHERRMERLELWIQLARVLKTDLIQIPANFLPAEFVTDDIGLIVADLQKVADVGLAQSPPIRFAYESLCWSTRIDTWEACWDVVQRVDRPNFGMCLDTFNIAGRIYADPASPTGRVPGAEQAVRGSMRRLVAEVDVAKVFYVQVVDAERLQDPLVEGHAFYVPDQPARMSWSRNCRLFYGERDRGAYLPVKDIASTLFHGLSYEGWVSLELFHRRMAEEGAEVPEELASRGAASWSKLARDMKLQNAAAYAATARRFAASL